MKQETKKDKETAPTTEKEPISNEKKAENTDKELNIELSTLMLTLDDFTLLQSSPVYLTLKENETIMYKTNFNFF